MFLDQYPYWLWNNIHINQSDLGLGLGHVHYNYTLILGVGLGSGLIGLERIFTVCLTGMLCPDQPKKRWWNIFQNKCKVKMLSQTFFFSFKSVILWTIIIAWAWC